jgi:hypothetical protein
VVVSYMPDLVVYIVDVNLFDQLNSVK